MPIITSPQKRLTMCLGCFVGDESVLNHATNDQVHWNPGHTEFLVCGDDIWLKMTFKERQEWLKKWNT